MGGTLTLDTNVALRTVDLSALSQVEGLVMRRNLVLANATTDCLRTEILHGGSVSVTQNPELDCLALMQALTHAVGASETTITGCAAVDPGASPQVCACGDETLGIDEACDDGNPGGGDGCDGYCQVETGYTCVQQPVGGPSVCSACGNGVVEGAEECDDPADTAGETCDPVTCMLVTVSTTGAPTSPPGTSTSPPLGTVTPAPRSETPTPSLTPASMTDDPPGASLNGTDSPLRLADLFNVADWSTGTRVGVLVAVMVLICLCVVAVLARKKCSRSMETTSSESISLDEMLRRKGGGGRMSDYSTSTAYEYYYYSGDGSDGSGDAPETEEPSTFGSEVRKNTEFNRTQLKSPLRLDHGSPGALTFDSDGTGSGSTRSMSAAGTSDTSAATSAAGTTASTSDSSDGGPTHNAYSTTVSRSTSDSGAATTTEADLTSAETSIGPRGDWHQPPPVATPRTGVDARHTIASRPATPLAPSRLASAGNNDEASYYYYTDETADPEGDAEAAAAAAAVAGRATREHR